SRITYSSRVSIDCHKTLPRSSRRKFMPGSEEFRNWKIRIGYRKRIVGVEWAIAIKQVGNEMDNKNYLSVNLKLVTEDLPAEWSCGVFQTMHIISQWDRNTKHSISPGNMAVFDADHRVWGLPGFIAIEKLSDGRKGFMTDDSIIVAIDVVVYPTRRTNV
ncbi:hypothetical protein PFISCL1PPCAC_20313, partial [Pristionchus fissidentatus]